MANVSVSLGLKNAGFKRGLDEARGQVRSFKRDLEAGGGLFGKIGAGMGLIAGTVAAATKVSLDYASTLQDTADALSINVEELQGLRAAFAESGTSAQKFDLSMSKLIQRIEDAKGGNAAAIEAFGTLGVSLSDLQSLDPGAILLKMADGFKVAGGNGAALSAAIDILGKGGRTMAAGMKEGADGIREVADAADKLRASAVGGLDAAGDSAGRIANLLKNRVAEAVTGAALMLDDFLYVLTGKRPLGVMKGMVAGSNPSPNAGDVKTGATTSAAAQMAANAVETDKERANLDQQRLENARAMMSAQEKIVSLERERDKLLEKARGAELNESLRLRTEAEKVQGQINSERKQIEEKQQQDRDRIEAANEAADNEHLAKLEEIDKQKKAIASDRAAARADYLAALDQARTAESGGKLDAMVSRARMSPAERSQFDRASRAEQRAQIRGEAAFIRKYGRDEYLKVLASRDPAKQAAEAYKQALSKSEAELSAVRLQVTALNSKLSLPR